MKLGHLRSLQTHVRRHPPPVSRRPYRAPRGEPTYNLHIREASASRNSAELLTDSVQMSRLTIITAITPPLSGLIA
jgi:hypothetical protein